MPHLQSRIDDVGWLTPSVADVLDDLVPLPFPEKLRREQVSTIQNVLEQAGVPCRAVRVSVFPSQTLFVMQSAGRKRGQPLHATAVAMVLPLIKDALGAIRIGVVPELERTPHAVGILVRMPQNQPLRLRNLLITPVFQAASQPTNLALGLDLDMQAVLCDLTDLSHIMLLGEPESVYRSMQALLTTLVLFNTPEELKLALISPAVDRHSATMAAFNTLPHILGQRLRHAEDGLKLLKGMLTEAKRRVKLLEGRGVRDVNAYNAQMQSSDAPLARIVLMIEDIFSPEQAQSYAQWDALLTQLLPLSAQAGIHLIATGEVGAVNKMSAELKPLTPNRLILGSPPLLKDMWQASTPFPAGFINGYWRQAEQFVPLLIGLVSTGEVSRIAAYWQGIAAQRQQDGAGSFYFDDRDQSEAKPRLPFLQRPTSVSLLKATDALTPYDVKESRSRALAAYLGWLGIGPLRDVLGFSDEEAEAMIEHLQTDGVLERGFGPMWRFVRLDGLGK